MAKGGYIGVGSTAHKLKGGYVGVGGTAYEFNKGYVGVGGTAYEFSFADTEALLDELFSGMTRIEYASTNANSDAISIPAVANSYYIAGGPINPAAGNDTTHYGFFCISYYDGTSMIPIWSIWPEGGTGYAYIELNGSSVSPVHFYGTSSTETEETGMQIARVTFPLDPKELVSHLSVFSTDGSMSDGNTDADSFRVGTSGRTNPSYYIASVSGYVGVGKLKDGVFTQLYNSTGFYYDSANNRVYYSTNGTSSSKGRGMIAGFNYTP